MLLVGLTGSIGMGKSATAAMFREEGVAVHDSDAAVHALYRGPAASEVEKHFPGVTVDGTIDRTRLAPLVLNQPEKMKLLESIIHPLVEKSRQDFLESQAAASARFAIVDIPLLFEIGGERQVDVILVVSAPDHIQEQRVMARPGMTRERFLSIRARQIPNREKVRRAHALIDTSRGFPAARLQVGSVIRALSAAG